ncbi:MAG: ATP-binding protein [Candidatus Methanoperedens sp.]|nr:ATP-binding protein [Candidatus Methanoperedens sp.]
MARLNLERINGLINEKIKENLNLDYKRELDERNNEIAKDISAFANASGGKIIYGISEKDDLPSSINWIESKGVKVKIEDIILNHIQPELKGYEIYSIENSGNHSQAIFVVDIPESSDAPHMADYRYYIRRNFKSEYMEDSEVKNAIFKKGLRKALEFEVLQNIEMANSTYKRLESYTISHKRAPILLIPFYTEAWRAIVSSGILFILKDKATTLVEAYSTIYEINYLIDSLRYEKYGKEECVYTQYDTSKPEHGTWLPMIIRDKIAKLQGILQKVKLD